MTTFILVLLVLTTLVFAMSIGVIMGRKPIAGSCGGLGAVGIDGACTVCGGNPKQCDSLKDAPASADDQGLAYDATKKNGR